MWTFVRGPIKALGWLLLVITLIANIYLYYYPLLQPATCSWKPDAQVRLLAFGDPQIRGADAKSSYRTKLDLYGNDHYLGHIYKTLVEVLEPQHVAVMGDLVSSQWIPDDNFYERVQRYRTRIFRPELLPTGTTIINITGNHDIGYAGEVTPERVARYTNAFGQLNFIQHFGNNEEDKYRIVVLNSLVLDGPMAHFQFQENTWQFLEDVVARDKFKGPTILLTHVPLAKPAGLCSDGPYFTYYGEEFGNVLREQNHLTEKTSQRVLDLVFGPGNPYGGVILTGHDHEGCESTYYYDEGRWAVSAGTPATSASSHPMGAHGVYEITVRSMMGEFGGNGGLLSGRQHNGMWEFEFSLCALGVQHIWWASKILVIVSVGIVVPVLSLLHTGML